LEKCKHIQSKLTFILTEDDGWIPAQALQQVIQQYFAKAKVIEIKGGHMFHEANETYAIELIEAALNEERGES